VNRPGFGGDFLSWKELPVRKRYPRELRECVVRLMAEYRGEYARPLNRDGSARHVEVNSRSPELEVRCPPRAIEPGIVISGPCTGPLGKSFETLARQCVSRANHDLAGRVQPN
jgi:hypothetical protein